MTARVPASTAAAPVALGDHTHARAQPGSVDTLAIVDGSVTTAKIVDDAVTAAKLNNDVYATTVTTIDPDDGAVTGTVGGRLAPFDHQHPITTGTPAALTKTATSAESAGTGFARDGHVHATSALPWGIVARQVLTSSEGPYTGNTTTAFSLVDVPVDVTRLYRVNIHQQVSFSVGAGNWSLRLMVDGVLHDFLSRMDGSATFSEVVTDSVLWEPATGTPDLTVQAAEESGGASITLNGAATVKRWFWVEDIGPR